MQVHWYMFGSSSKLDFPFQYCLGQVIAYTNPTDILSNDYTKPFQDGVNPMGDREF